MPKFRKAIVKAGVYNVANPKGERRTEIITPERIQHWAATHGEMQKTKTGFQIPAPWAHSYKLPDGRVFIPGPVEMSNPSAGRSDMNAGFWDNLTAEIDPTDGLMTLYGVLDAPGDPADFKTPAGKIGKTVRETSILALPSYPDGKGNEFKDILGHIALVTHPIEPGQTNFEEVKSYALAMSHFAFKLGDAVTMSFPEPPPTEEVDGEEMGDEEGELEDEDEVTNAVTQDVSTLIPLLRDCGIVLPDDTTITNLVERLQVALGQKSFVDDDEDEGYGENGNDKKKKGSVTKPPEGAEEESSTTFMSTNNTPVALTEATLMSHPVVTGLKAQNDGFLKHITATEKAIRKNRINTLVKNGQIEQKYATEKLLPMAEAFQMNFTPEGNVIPHALDSVLEALEATPAKTAAEKLPGFVNPQMAAMAGFMMSASAPEGSDTPTDPNLGFVPLKAEEIASAADQLMLLS